MSGERCFFFGCWGEVGHYLFGVDGRSITSETARPVVWYAKAGEDVHIDGTLAPLLWWRGYGGGITFAGNYNSSEERHKAQFRTEECPPGQFLLHVLSNGFTAIQWWDRNQGDSRGASNSTILLEGTHTAEEMLAALAEHFPRVLANLKRAGIELVQVTAGDSDSDER